MNTDNNTLAARQQVDGLSWADYWMERGQSDVAHAFDEFSRAEAWALQRFQGAREPVTATEARRILTDHLANGRRIIPLAACEGFDYGGTGCPGHLESTAVAHG